MNSFVSDCTTGEVAGERLYSVSKNLLSADTTDNYVAPKGDEPFIKTYVSGQIQPHKDYLQDSFLAAKNLFQSSFCPQTLQ